MISIGQRLSDQRRRRGMTLEECEAATHIRGRHLIALEEDRPGDIPDPAYARLFLRGYAVFLGLDADALAAEHDERRGAASPLEEHRVVPLESGPGGRWDELRRWVVRPRRRSRRREAGWAAIGLLGAIAVVLWMGARSGSPPPPQPAAEAPVPAASGPSTPARTIATGRHAPGPAGADRPGDERVVGEGGARRRVGPRRMGRDDRARPGVRLRLSGTLWMRVGWAPSVRVALGGREVPLAGGTGDYLVRSAGVTPAT